MHAVGPQGRMRRVQLRLEPALCGLPAAIPPASAILDCVCAGSGLRHTAMSDTRTFSGITPETLEAIPSAGDRRTHLRYYWESGHFKKELGDRAMARILGNPVDFGVQLRGETIDAWVAEDRRSVQALLATPGPLQAEVDDIVARTRQK